MRLNRIRSGQGNAELAREIRDSVPPPDAVAAVVSGIIERVRAEGDAALRALTLEHDTEGREPPPLRVAAGELDAAVATLDPSVRAGLELAMENVRTVAEAGLHPDREVEFENHEVILREAPVRRAAVYVPGGRAPYPSTVVMGVITARAAGVEHVAVATPPGPGADIDSAILAACRLTGATEVYRMGGAQAIAALVHGTPTIEPVDVVVGPGNLYVQEAKRQLSGRVGIDSFAGPSDLLVIADDNVDPELVTLDLLAQAEHGEGALVVAASTSAPILDAVEARLREARDTGALAWLVELTAAEHALPLAEAFAPEHLELLGPRAEQLADRITRAGCLFVGSQTGTAFGDYIAGSNHTLPTNGAARFASALSPAHFRRAFAQVRITDASALARAAAPLARAEGFEQHARSMEARIRENHPR